MIGAAMSHLVEQIREYIKMNPSSTFPAFCICGTFIFVVKYLV